MWSPERCAVRSRRRRRSSCGQRSKSHGATARLRGIGTRKGNTGKRGHQSQRPAGRSHLHLLFRSGRPSSAIVDAERLTGLSQRLSGIARIGSAGESASAHSRREVVKREKIVSEKLFVGNVWLLHNSD